MRFLIFWGVANSYGGISSSALITVDSLEEAELEAKMRSFEEAQELYGIGEDEIDTWLDYYVIKNPTNEQIEKAKQYDFENEIDE